MRHIRWRCANGCRWGAYMAVLRAVWQSCPFCGCDDIECEGG